MTIICTILALVFIIILVVSVASSCVRKPKRFVVTIAEKNRNGRETPEDVEVFDMNTPIKHQALIHTQPHQPFDEPDDSGDYNVGANTSTAYFNTRNDDNVSMKHYNSSSRIHELVEDEEEPPKTIDEPRIVEILEDDVTDNNFGTYISTQPSIHEDENEPPPEPTVGIKIKSKKFKMPTFKKREPRTSNSPQP